MGYTNDYLTDIGATTAADPSVLAEARNRLALVRDIAGQFPGALRTYASGSLSQHTVTHPVSDGDGGLVLNRVNYPGLGPEGGGEIPNDVTAQLCKLLGPRVRECYPNARCGTSKRGPKITFGAPINDQDPSVDLVVALTRREGNGLWIPNLKLERWALRPGGARPAAQRRAGLAASHQTSRHPAGEGMEQTVDRPRVLLLPPVRARARARPAGYGHRNSAAGPARRCRSLPHRWPQHPGPGRGVQATEAAHLA